VNNFTLGDSAVSFFPISFFEYFMALLTVLYTVISIIIIAIINNKRNKKMNAVNWKQNSNRILASLITFIFVVSILIYALISFGLIKYIIPSFLITYGFFMCVINKFTQKNIYCFYFILLGMVTYLFPEYQFILFGIGFGLGYFIYGLSYYILKDQFSIN